MIDYRGADERFVTREDGRTTWHSLSFGAHYDPANVALGPLVAHNDERLPPGTGYADHPHADVEIVTWVVSGALRHSSEAGQGVVRRGQVQRLSAGSGVVHSEVAEGDEETRFLQAWLRPDEAGLAPDYLARDVDLGDGWTVVADAGGQGVVPIAVTGAALHVARLEAGQELALPEAPLLHVFVAAGSVQLGERLLHDGDAARLVHEGGRAVQAETAAELVVWALPGGALRG